MSEASRHHAVELGAGLKSGFESVSINSVITAGTAVPWTETIPFLGESYSAVSAGNVSVCVLEAIAVKGIIVIFF